MKLHYAANTHAKNPEFKEVQGGFELGKRAMLVWKLPVKRSKKMDTNQEIENVVVVQSWKQARQVKIRQSVLLIDSPASLKSLEIQ